MPVNIHGRSFLTLQAFSSKELNYLLNLSADLKAKKRSGTKGNLLSNKSVVLIFNKPSTRTRCAFEVAVHDEGGDVTFLSNSHMGKKESIEDTACVLGRMYDGIEFRGYDHAEAEALAQYSGVPVWNGLTDLYHPTQILADFLTIREQVDKPLNKIKFVFVGDARNNMGNSLMIGAAKMGMHFVGLGPKSLWPKDELLEETRAIAHHTGATIEYEESVDKAVADADVIYTDVWVSMGEEDQFAERIELLQPYQVNQEMVNKTNNKNLLFLHCLPAFHDLNTEVAQKVREQFGLAEMEVTDEVFRSKHSKVFDQAENRLHTIKAVMVATIGNL